jgi:hypothetical protein
MMVKKRSTGEHPFLNMEVEGKKELCLLDTGSGITIFNPSKGCTDETDEGFKTFKVIGECSTRIHSYAGEMMVRKRVGWGWVGAKAEPQVPRVLFWQDTQKGSHGFCSEGRCWCTWEE